MKYPVTWIVFDWDGVISDSFDQAYASNMRILDLFDKKTMTLEVYRREAKPSMVGFMRDQGITASDDSLIAMHQAIYKQLVNEGIFPTVYPGAREALQKVHDMGKPMIVLSAHHSDNLLEEAMGYEVDGMFEDMIGSCRDKEHGLKQLCRSNGHNPTTGIYVGDTIGDIQAARGAGMLSAAVCNGYQDRNTLMHENPTLPLLDSVTELPNWIR